MKGIIWYCPGNRAKGIERFKKLIEDYESIQINKVRMHISSYEGYVDFENGDIWKLYKASDSSCGQACNIALIDCDIPKDMLNCAIMPCIKQRPYRAYNYY